MIASRLKALFLVLGLSAYPMEKLTKPFTERQRFDVFHCAFYIFTNGDKLHLEPKDLVLLYKRLNHMIKNILHLGIILEGLGKIFNSKLYSQLLEGEYMLDHLGKIGLLPKIMFYKFFNNHG